MPEGDPELPDEGLPDELPEEEDCPKPEDIYRLPTESLPDGD